jgi:hypothetical protein
MQWSRHTRRTTTSIACAMGMPRAISSLSSRKRLAPTQTPCSFTPNPAALNATSTAPIITLHLVGQDVSPSRKPCSTG